MGAGEYLHPGLYLEEVGGLPRIQGVGVTTAGFVGVARKGPLDKSDLVINWTQFVEKYGSFWNGNFLAYSVKAFFDEGGKRAYIARIAGSGAAASTKNLKDYGESNDTFKIDAINEGTWGDNLTVTTLLYTTTTAGAIATGATTVVLASVNNVRKGDLLHIDDGTNDVQVFVVSINTTTKAITFKAVGTITTVTSGATVTCSTSHKTSTTITQSLANGATSVNLASTRNVVKGTRMYFDDGTNNGQVLVTGVNGNTITFGAITLAGTLASGTLAVSMEFNLKVKEDGTVVKVHEYLSMEDTNEVDFIEVRCAGLGNESKHIELTDLDSATSDSIKHIPFPVEDINLAGGGDGATPTDNDYIGVAAAPKTGIYLFDSVDEVNIIATPGIETVAVAGNGYDYCEARKDCMYISATPLADDEPLEAQEYRNVELNKDTSYGALYYPWLLITDPENSNNILQMPPEGWVMGEYADVVINRGIHKAPANVTLRGVQGLTYKVEDGEQDILNPDGINCIRIFEGEGIRIWGARTLYSVKDGFHYVNVRRLLLYIEESIIESSRWAVFEPNDEALWGKLKRSIEGFLTALWKKGMLFPRTDISRAFYVKCDSELNTQAEVDAGRVNVEIGVNPSKPAEFVIFRVGLWDGGSLISELT